MKSALDTTTNALERIDFAFSAIDNFEGQNLESILSNKENVIETYKLARDKEHISNIKTKNYSNILEYGNSETLYDGYNNESLNESLKNDINTSSSSSSSISSNIFEFLRTFDLNNLITASNQYTSFEGFESYSEVSSEAQHYTGYIVKWGFDK